MAAEFASLVEELKKVRDELEGTGTMSGGGVLETGEKENKCVWRGEDKVDA